MGQSHRLALTGGSYSARSILANAQRCVNYYPEVNRQDSPVPITHYQRPGLVPLVQGPPGPVRAIYRSSTNAHYTVIGLGVFLINPDWSLVQIGTLDSSDTSTLVSITDNRSDVFLVDRSPNGYTWKLGNPLGTFSQITDSTFTGATKVDYIDTFMLWNVPNSNQFGSTLSNELVFDPTYIVAKTAWPDNLRTLIVNNHEILLLGAQRSEVWYDAGGVLFPFAELPGAYIEHGCVADYSVASSDISVFWLGQDAQGQGVVFRRRGYQTTRISNHALEYQIRKIYNSGTTISDAQGFTYQFDGHTFYQLTFPSGNQTWLFDDAISDPMLAWHQEAWTNPIDGSLNRHRANCFGYLGQLVCGDWENGTIYKMDPDVYVDTLVPNAPSGPITFIRTFPHLMIGTNPQGQPVGGEGKIIQHDAFLADFEVGEVAPQGEITLRYSDDRGKTWSTAPIVSTGALGQYDTRPLVTKLGQAMDRVYELSHSLAGPAALNGAWVEGRVIGT